MKLGFRDFLEKADKEARRNKVNDLLDGGSMILFFTKGDGCFGAPEESRLVFAKMKSTDDDMPDGWADEANFAAFDLLKALTGDQAQSLFSVKDLKSIKVLDRDKMGEKLMDYKPKNIQKPIPNKLQPKQSQHGVGIISIKDKK